MAHKKGAGSSKNGRESHSKRLGVKLFGGQEAIPGNIIIRQRGTKYHPGSGVGIGKDHTIFATVEGTVLFRRKKDNRLYVSVIPANGVDVAQKPAPKKAVKSKTKDETVKQEAPVAKEEAAEEVTVAKPETPVVEAPKKEEKQTAKKEEPKAAALRKEEKKADEGELSEEEAASKMKDLLANVGEADASNKDDLKKIKGVGPVFEKKLNSIGIYTFEQLTKLDDKGIDALEALTKQGGRVRRDDWIGQAKELMKG